MNLHAPLIYEFIITTQAYGLGVTQRMGKSKEPQTIL